MGDVHFKIVIGVSKRKNKDKFQCFWRCEYWKIISSAHIREEWMSEYLNE